jgi:hypothetical protein
MTVIMDNKTLTVLQKFRIGFGLSFTISTTNILKNSDLLIIVKKKHHPHIITLTEVEALNLFCVYPSILNIVTNCDLQGTMSYMV